MSDLTDSSYFECLFQQSSDKRVRAQANAVELLLEKFPHLKNGSRELHRDPLYRALRELLSEATSIFGLSDVQQAVYHNDSGTAFLPELIKKALLTIRSRFVVRPGTLADLQQFVRYAREHRVHYCIRGAGTWPFGGAVPMNQEVILDLSYLDFYQLKEDEAILTVGPGVIFADMRQFLRRKGFALRQDITNPHSGTICGWVATGGIGLGVYKYGPVREAVEAVLLLKPDGRWHIVHRENEAFDRLFSSEGQLGIIAGVALRVQPLTYVSKPFAFSLPDARAVRRLVELIQAWGLRPTSILYFDRNYLATTYEIEREKVQAELNRALEKEDELLIRRARSELDVVEQLRDLQHTVVLEFDTREDYQAALKYPLFSATRERRRYQGLVYDRLPASVAHKLWDHRYQPVQMKQKGPSMLVSETIVPLKRFPEYMAFIQSAISDWTQNPVKTEGHVVNGEEVLLQTILLANTDTLRHKTYLGLVPFMTQAAIHFGGRPYGIGIWNLPFLKSIDCGGSDRRVPALWELKKQWDPLRLVNQVKFVNPVGRRLSLRLFQKITPIFMSYGVRLLWRGRENGRGMSLYSIPRLFWKLNKLIFPRVIPPRLETPREPILQMAVHCAECDSCERVCPTSDVFGLLGVATPVTRRKTAVRLARGENISQLEALGFLVCTRCDNCTRICPTDIPLTRMFDLVEADTRFQLALGVSPEDKADFIERFWDIMKQSPLYRKHTQAQQKAERSHLEHGLKMLYPKGFPYGKLFIDPETCIRCGMCAHENACTYGARIGRPREIPLLLDENCSLCNACINFCPQNKAIQAEREYMDELIEHAVDLEEKRYWENRKKFLRDTTVIQRSPELTDMADIYLTEDILMEIDKEASTGQIPVSGMGQGDRHMGIGFDAERFSHFHIVGPAQNRLHEGDPDEELSVTLGRRYRYCRFDEQGRLHNPEFPTLKLKSPILYNAVPLESNGRVELAFIRVAEQQGTLVVIKFHRFLEYYDFWKEEGQYEQLPPVIVPRFDQELIDHLQVHPHVTREVLTDLWGMPMFEVLYHDQMDQTIEFIRNSVAATNGRSPLICGYLEVSEYDIVGGMEILPHLQQKLEDFLRLGVDVIHIHGLRNKDHYFVTSQAVRAVHHYLLVSGRRHLVSLIASGGIRLASDSQKTIQRGAAATLIDFAALLALDPYAYRAILERKTTTEKLMNLDIDWAVQRLNNQMESRKVQILEVLGAAGFKDLKKTVGEEGRLIDFYELEERIQKQIFEDENRLALYEKLNRQLMASEPLPEEASPRFSELKRRVVPLRPPHDFYHLEEVNQSVYRRDHVWPGEVIETLGRMAAGDPQMMYLRRVKGTGLLGDGFDVMKILYQRDPDHIPEEELDHIRTAVLLDKDLILRAPWMFGGKSVGSIGLDSWRAHVVAARELGIQYDTGEGGYPTCFFLNRKGEPIFFTEPDIQAMKPHFQHDRQYTVREIIEILQQQGITPESHPRIYQTLRRYPELQPFLFYVVVDQADEPFVSTELKTGLFGVTKETIKKARRVVIAYSQGAKMGIGGHILAQKVNRLVAYLRGVEGLEYLDTEKIQQLIQKLEKIEQEAHHPLKAVSRQAFPYLQRTFDENEIFPELKQWLWRIQQRAYELHSRSQLDPIEFEHILRLTEEVIGLSYTSIISPFPFHNCYSIEDVKAFIDVVRMINPRAVVSVKVSPSVDIEFIAAGLGRIAKDNTEEILNQKAREVQANTLELSRMLSDYARTYGMRIELWLDGPRGGTGASPNIIKGQMGMHIEYAIPLIHDRLVQDGLRNYVKFFVSGGIRTYEDVIKAIALGADGVIWGTAPMVAIGCDRNRNCHDGCSRGIATSNLVMQNLRDVEINSRQIINAFLIMQMQVIRALAGLGLKDIRELRGRFDKIQWLGLKERVDFRIRQYRDYLKQRSLQKAPIHPTGQSNCGVAAVIGTHNVPSDVLDHTLAAMKNRGMDGVGVGKTLCFPEFPDHYAYRIMVKGKLQLEVEENLRQQSGPMEEREFRYRARQELLKYRFKLAESIKKVFLEPYFDFAGDTRIDKVRERYKCDEQGRERDYREFGNENTDPGDVFRFFVRVKPRVLQEFIEQDILLSPRFAYIREYFPEVKAHNYRHQEKFLRKAEDLFVFNHSVMLTQILYVWDVAPDSWNQFIKNHKAFKEYLPVLTQADPLSDGFIEIYGETFLYLLRDFIRTYPWHWHKEQYIPRIRRIAAVMSCGKNFAVWKTAGRQIPWETPPSPNNIIHVRLATGSIVEQMNAHPFAKLHTALTHNGETTNYETLKQRVEQFGLPPLATTDTEVASLKFHLLAEELEYPDWALFESFSPTTGDDLALMPPEIRRQLEEVQRVEFTSSPDGPYQYLCLRHLPHRRVTERVDLKDPADLRPSTTALWVDKTRGKKRAFSIIASEEQAIQQMLELLDQEGLIDGAAPDRVMVSQGMISRYHFDESGRITSVEWIDRYGRPMPFEEFGRHYSFRRNALRTPRNAPSLQPAVDDFLVQAAQGEWRSFAAWMEEQLREWDFNTYRWIFTQIVGRAAVKHAPAVNRLFTFFIDYLRRMDTGDKAKSSLLDITRKMFYEWLDNLGQKKDPQWVWVGHKSGAIPSVREPEHRILLVDARGFLPEGTDPDHCLAAFLSRAYDRGWRRFILYRVNGQRLISTAVMGRTDTDDVVMDVYGVPGEYFGAFMQGGTIRLHGNAQNFCAMTMHHGNLYVFGNAGKVCGYASKGGRVFILGDIVDRAWTNSVNDPRCQELQVHVLGSASKYCGESLMGGRFFFGGMYFDSRGRLRIQERPYRGTKLLGGASRGKMLFFDPYDRLHPRQYTHGKLEAIDRREWPRWQQMVLDTLRLAGVAVEEHQGVYRFVADDRVFEITPMQFKLIVPQGGLKGYESH